MFLERCVPPLAEENMVVSSTVPTYVSPARKEEVKLYKGGGGGSTASSRGDLHLYKYI